MIGAGPGRAPPTPPGRPAAAPRSWGSSTSRPTPSPTAAATSTSTAAVAHGVDLAEAGADLVDVGGESTRPGAQRVPAGGGAASGAAGHRRARSRRACPVSIDTMRADVAPRRRSSAGAASSTTSAGAWPTRRCYARGRDAVACPTSRCTGGGTSDRHGGARALRRRRAPTSSASCRPAWTPRRPPGSIRAAIVLDPGLGFAKDADHNWPLLAHLDELVGARAAGAGRRLAQALPRRAARRRLTGEPRPMERARPRPRTRSSALAAAHGVWCVRVHDVTGSRDAVARGARPGGKVATDARRDPPSADIRGVGRHGVFAHETRDGQDVRRRRVPARSTRGRPRPATTWRTPSTTAWSRHVRALVVEGAPVDLIETLAERIAAGVPG